MIVKFDAWLGHSLEYSSRERTSQGSLNLVLLLVPFLSLASPLGMLCAQYVALPHQSKVNEHEDDGCDGIGMGTILV